MTIDFMKKWFTRFPYPVGKLVSYVPFSARPLIGKGYRQSLNKIEYYYKSNAKEKRRWIFNNMREITIFAYENIPFYREYYYSHGFNPSQLSSFDDLQDIPLVDKSTLQEVNIEERSYPEAGRALVNTGGSSGTPLSFYISPNLISHEWAHVHRAWSNIGFNPSELKIMFGGRSSIKNIVEYDSARHSLVVDISRPHELIADKLFDCIKWGPSFIHGYPSAIFEFLLWVSENNHPLYYYLKENIKGMIFSSEFPSPPLRKKVFSIYGIKSLSFYGHTERSVLATEEHSEYEFYPLQTYGFCESIRSDGKDFLVGTSYYNRASPLIRYNTEDIIKPIKENNLLSCFKILDGRRGDFILDSTNQKISLTALIFGRHHKVFDFASSIQVHQPKAGFATILIVLARHQSHVKFTASEHFDASNVNIDFDFKIIPQPIRTYAGKTPLLVRSF